MDEANLKRYLMSNYVGEDEEPITIGATVSVNVSEGRDVIEGIVVATEPSDKPGFDWVTVRKIGSLS